MLTVNPHKCEQCCTDNGDLNDILKQFFITLFSTKVTTSLILLHEIISAYFAIPNLLTHFLLLLFIRDFG